MRLGISAALLAVLAFSVPASASADPLGEGTFYSEGLRGSASFLTTFTPGPDGNVWFVDNRLMSGAPAIGRITPKGAITEYIGGEGLTGLNEESDPISLVAGPKGSKYIWFTDRGTITPSIGVIDSAGSEETKEAKEFSIQEKGGNAESMPLGITVGPEGNLWFTDAHETAPAIGKIELGAENEIKKITECSAGLNAESKPLGIVTGADGNLWFIDGNPTARAIGKVNPSTCEIEEFATGENSEPGGSNSEFGPWGIVAGPDGNVWFTENGTNEANGKALCRITPSGTITCFKEGLVATSSPSTGLTVGGGKLWFSDNSGVNEEQELEISATENLGGTYKLSFGGKETGAIGKGNVTSGSKEIKSVTTSKGAFSNGEQISGEGIPAGDTIASGAGTSTLKLAVAATETKTGVALSADLPAKATGSQVAGALQKLSTIGSGGASGGGTGTVSPIKRSILFEGPRAHADVEQLSCNGAGLIGPGASCTVTTLKQGLPNAIGCMTTSGKACPKETRWTFAELHSGVFGMTLGPDGNVWVGSGFGFQPWTIGRFGIKGSGQPNLRTLTLTKSAGGTGGTGTVSSKPKGINCATACNKAVARMYENSTVVLKAKASTGSTIASWTGCESSTGVGGIEGTCTIKLTEDKEVKVAWSGTSKAIVEPTALTLSKGESEANRGKGTVKAAGLVCESECSEETVLYQGPVTLPKPKPGKLVELKETPAFGSEFTGWSGGGCSGTEPVCKVTMETANSVTAEFAAKPSATLTLKKNSYATGTGTVTSKPKGINCATTCTTQDASVPEGEAIVLKEKPALGMTFTGWSGGGCSGTAETCTVKLSEATTVTATFSGSPKAIAEAKTLTLTRAGSGFGTVKATGLTCEALCTSATSLYAGPVTSPKVKPGATVILKATSAPGSKAVAWTGCKSNPTPSECLVEMSEDKSVTATFDELE
jgi:streptogramin lyase